MDGVHDLGGMHGFGAVHREPNEPPFHHPWEGRVHGMMIALGVGGHPLSGFRHAIERMDAAEYLSTTYYEHWLAAVETLLLEAGRVSRDELADAVRRAASPAHDVPRRNVAGEGELVRALFGARAQHETAPVRSRFATGDAVRVRRMSPSGHTRCPRYVRGVAGVVDRVNGPSPLQDALPERRLEAYYTVRFRSQDLWGADADPFTVTVDLYESYLEPAS